MARQSKLILNISETRSVTIYGTRTNQPMRTAKAVVCEYRGWVLLLGENGKVYSPQTHGSHIANCDILTGHKKALLRGLQMLGVLTEAEVQSAFSIADRAAEAAERRRVVRSLRMNAHTLGIKLPVTLERKLAKVAA